MPRIGLYLIAVLLIAGSSFAQEPASGLVRGRVTDDGGGVLPGVSVELRAMAGGSTRQTLTSATGDYAFAEVAAGRYQLSFTLINFASVVRRDVDVASAVRTVNAVMHLALNAEVTVTGERSFI